MTSEDGGEARKGWSVPLRLLLLLREEALLHPSHHLVATVIEARSEVDEEEGK
jgi:hypothetical protein